MQRDRRVHPRPGAHTLQQPAQVHVSTCRSTLEVIRTMGAAKISMTQQVVALPLVWSEMSPAMMPPRIQTNWHPAAPSGTTAAH